MGTDVTSSKDVDRMVRSALDEFGRIDILVNNAGINTKYRMPFYEQPEEDWLHVIEVDVKGTWLCAKAVSLEMIKRKSGRIVNIASTAGIASPAPPVQLRGSQGGRDQAHPGDGDGACAPSHLGQLRRAGGTLTEGVKKGSTRARPGLRRCSRTYPSGEVRSPGR